MKPSSVSQPLTGKTLLFKNIVQRKSPCLRLSVVVLSVHDIERESHDALSVFYLGVTNKRKLFDISKVSASLFESLTSYFLLDKFVWIV